MTDWRCNIVDSVEAKSTIQKQLVWSESITIENEWRKWDICWLNKQRLLTEKGTLCLTNEFCLLKLKSWIKSRIWIRRLYNSIQFILDLAITGNYQLKEVTVGGRIKRQLVEVSVEDEWERWTTERLLTIKGIVYR